MGYLFWDKYLQTSMAEAVFGPQKSLQVQDIICLCEQYQGNQQKKMFSDTSFLEQNHLHIDSSKSRADWSAK